MKERAHEIVAEIKRVALELGRTPTRAEFEARSQFTKWSIDCAFGSYRTAIQAAGLMPKTQKVDHSKLFNVSVQKQIEDHKSLLSAPNHSFPAKFPIVVIGDAHFPFINVDILTWIYQMIDAIKPGQVVQIGDLYDYFAMSRFPRSLNTYSPDEEVRLGREMACDLWRTVQKLAPGAECYQILGNHCIRPMKALIAKAPELEPFMREKFKEHFEFDGVTTIHDPRQELYLGNTIFQHGYRSKLGEHAMHNQMSTVCGHSHVGGCLYFPLYKPGGKSKIIFEANAGLGPGDPESKALGYTPQKITKWTQGILIIYEEGPMFVPALL